MYYPTEGSDTDREWWVQQWLDLLDKYRFKKRLERGRNYARQGNVLSIEFRAQKVVARVQGTEKQPYKISLGLETFSDEDWNFVFDTLSERTLFSAKLLSGVMPTNIEDIFAANGLRLFPFSLPEIESRCSCPDKANPCKHIIAVYHLLGERFADDPFLLFQLRGRSKHETIAALRARQGAASADATAHEDEEVAPAAAPLDLSRFWSYDRPLDPSLIAIAPSSENAALDVLGSMPLAGGRHNIRATDIAALEAFLDRAYATARNSAVMQAMQLDSDET
ncbi:MAG: SWIM zinc finger family protein [Geitlerinemataceae cyanobacterium]